MNRKELNKAFEENLITEQQFKDGLFKLEEEAYQRKLTHKTSKKLPVSISEEEFVKLIQHTNRRAKKTGKFIREVEYQQQRIAFLLGYGSGLRISEIIHLRPEDVNFKEKNILVRQGKGRKDRIVPIPKGFKEEFLALLPITVGVRALEIAFKKSCAKAGLLKTKPELHFHCVDKNTEILTKKGWKKYNELKLKELIYTLNTKKDVIELKSLSKVYIYPKYSGDLYSFKNRYIDALFSPEHNLLVKINKKTPSGSSVWSDWKTISVEDLMNEKSKRMIKLRLSGIKEKGLYSIGKSKAALLGWILTDGHISKAEKDITIGQSCIVNKHKCDIIRKILKESGLKYSEHLHNFRILNKLGDTKWIFEWINDDRTPKWKLLNLPYEELMEIYNAMMELVKYLDGELMLGDGSRGTELCTQNKKRIDFFRTLCCLIGKRTCIGNKFRIYITNHNNCNILEKKHIKKIKYKGLIWCPNVDNGTWIARKNEQIFITSNSLRHGFCSRLAGKGVPIHHIRTLAGHSNISTTNIYLEANPQDALKEYEKYF